MRKRRDLKRGGGGTWCEEEEGLDARRRRDLV